MPIDTCDRNSIWTAHTGWARCYRASMMSEYLKQVLHPPPRPKAFVSYKDEEWEAASRVEHTLKSIGLDPFLAGHSISTNEEWKNRILAELRQCEIFVALVSEASCASPWCQQEVGFVLAREEVIRFSLRLDDTAPPGFLVDWQGPRIEPGVRPSACLFLPDLVEKMPRKILPQLIHRLATVNRHSAISNLRPHLAALDPDEAQRVAAICAENQLGWFPSDDCQSLLSSLLHHHSQQLDPTVVAKLQADLERPYVGSLSRF